MLQKYMPDNFRLIADYEHAFGVTIKRGATVAQIAAKGVAPDLDPHWLAIAMNQEFSPPVRIAPANWVLPLGAFGESAGPT
jgi:DNA sulfur modification protein DndC